MSAVSNQLHYKKLGLVVPVPLKFEGLYRLVQRIAIVAAVLFFTTYSGIVAGLLHWGFTSETGGAIGAVIGLVFGAYLTGKIKLPSNIEKYRISVFDQLRSVTSNPKSLEISEGLRDFFYQPFIGFREFYHHHLLQAHLALFGDHIDPTRPDASKIWKDFLNHLHGSPLASPDGEKITFNTSFLLRRIEKDQVNYAVAQLNTWSNPLKEEDLEQIQSIARSGFGKDSAYTKDQLLSKLKASGKIFAAKEQSTGKILGYGWFFLENGTVHIPEIARLPEVPKTNIGVVLLVEIIRAQKPGQPIEITLGKNNPYRQKLESYGFVPTKEIPKHYTKPKVEDAIVLSLDWQKYMEWSQKI